MKCIKPPHIGKIILHIRNLKPKCKIQCKQQAKQIGCLRLSAGKYREFSRYIYRLYNPKDFVA